DFRNILTAIGNCAEILAKKESQENLASISVIQQACSRGVHLIRHLAEFGKNSPGHPEVVSIRSIIEKFMPILRMAVGSSHQIDLQIDPSPGKLLIDSDELLRALINLIVNAKEAMPNGGTIDLRVLPWKKSRQFGSAKLAIEVRDHGCGMSDATLQQLFDPFFTTKPDGSGLGMPIVQRAVERVGGHIEVETKLGVGTTIRILLPVVSREGA
ncbi:MAG: ATP-binding protein, partial [Pirellulales bacterium]